MSSRSIPFLLAIVLCHTVAGKLRPISSDSGGSNRGDAHKKLIEMDLQSKLNSNNDLRNYKLGTSRVKRTANPNEPVASSPYILQDDHHKFANVHYSGGDSDVIFVLTYDISGGNHVTSSSLYRSLNYGKTFVSETNKFPAGARLHPIYHVSEDSKIIVFPDDSNWTIYISQDEGETYMNRSIPVDPRTLLYHPTEPKWVLGFDKDQHKLQVSLDLGNTWTLVSSNVRSLRDYSWGVPGVDWNASTTVKSQLSKIYYNTYNSSTSTVDENYDVFLMVTHFPFKTSSTVFDANLGLHDAFLIDDKYIFVQRTLDDNTGEVELLVSYNRKPFNIARIPFEDSHQSYYVGSYRSAQALVIVRHTSGLDNLYLSDETGTYYSLSLDRLVLVEQNGIDLELISSMNGTFIANQYVNNSLTHIRTVITFDNGAEWHLLEAPEVTKDGTETDCEVPLCSLHLQMYSTDFSRLGVYSRSSAPGIIIAHGNYGTYLASRGNVDLYISRDGGLRWKQTLASSWDAQIIDHGGLLVAAMDYHQLHVDETYISYSCDEGRNWVNFTFTDTSTVIWGVVTEPGETTTQVALFGSEDLSHPEWAIISINFTAVFERKCRSSDYWQWAVSDGRIASQNCLLGESRVIERRKTQTCCLSGEQYERIVSATPCVCAREDFECDWGYKSDEYNQGKCVVDVNFSVPKDENHADQPCVSGYRKIAGDTCVGGITDDLLNCTPPCSSSSSTTRSILDPTTNSGFITKSSTYIPTKSSTSTTSSSISTSSTTASSHSDSKTANGNQTPVSLTNRNANDGSSTTIIIILAILSALFFVVIIMLGTIIVYMKRHSPSSRHGGYRVVATREGQVSFRDTDEDDDDHDNDDVALLRP